MALGLDSCMTISCPQKKLWQPWRNSAGRQRMPGRRSWEGLCKAPSPCLGPAHRGAHPRSGLPEKLCLAPGFPGGQDTLEVFHSSWTWPVRRVAGSHELHTSSARSALGMASRGTMGTLRSQHRG